MKTILAIFLSVLFLFAVGANLGYGEWLHHTRHTDNPHTLKVFVCIFPIGVLIGLLVGCIKAFKEQKTNDTLGDVTMALIGYGAWGCTVGFFCAAIIVFIWPMIVYGLIHWGINYWYISSRRTRKILSYIGFICLFMVMTWGFSITTYFNTQNRAKALEDHIFNNIFYTKEVSTTSIKKSLLIPEELYIQIAQAILHPEATDEQKRGFATVMQKYRDQQKALGLPITPNF
jgi:hypothetical protein